MSPRSILRKSTIAVPVLAGLLVMATCLDYVWIGPVPVWLVLTIAFAMTMVVSKTGWSRLSNTARAIGMPIVLPWLAFVAAAVLSDTINGSLAESLSRIVFLDVATLMLAVTLASWSSLATPKAVVTLVALVAAVQGLVAIGQFLNVPGAWTLPDYIRQFSSNAGAVYASGMDQFADVGRVRGLAPLVHKFSALQGMLVAFLLVVLLGGRSSTRFSRVEYTLAFCCLLVGALGLLLTFTRSVILGMPLVLVVSLVLNKRFRKAKVVVPLFCAALAIAAIASALSVQGSTQFVRLGQLSAAQNEPRLHVWLYAVKAFWTSPLLGRGYDVGEDVLVIAIHSVPLRILASYGVVGIMPYLLVLIGAARLLLQGARRGEPARAAVCAGALAAVVMALLDASTHSSGLLFVDVPQPALLGMFLGQVAVTYPGRNKRLRRRGKLIAARTFNGPARIPAAQDPA